MEKRTRTATPAEEGLERLKNLETLLLSALCELRRARRSLEATARTDEVTRARARRALRRFGLRE
jgi:hypothetical protein